jgi:hypothetical protein
VLGPVLLERNLVHGREHLHGRRLQCGGDLHSHEQHRAVQRRERLHSW